MNEENNNFFNSDRAWLAVFGLVIILLFGYVIFRNSEAKIADKPGLAAVATTTDNTESLTATDSSGLLVPTQIPGDAVLVRYVKTTVPTWLSVNELDVTGQPTNLILGAALLRLPGIYQEQEIDLLRLTQEGGKYGVVLYRDSSSGQFSADPALLLRDKNGKIIVAPFTVETLGSRGTD